LTRIQQRRPTQALSAQVIMCSDRLSLVQSAFDPKQPFGARKTNDPSVIPDVISIHTPLGQHAMHLLAQAWSSLEKEMRRREFVARLAAVVARAPATAFAQEPGRIYHVGILLIGSLSPARSLSPATAKPRRTVQACEEEFTSTPAVRGKAKK
jgi:hypothetical protein